MKNLNIDVDMLNGADLLERSESSHVGHHLNVRKLSSGGGLHDVKRSMTGSDVLNFVESTGIKSAEICSALEISSNRWSALVKRSADGRDMTYEHITPTYEIFLRLCDRYPAHAPWRKVGPNMVMTLTGWDKGQLALVCGTSESNVERWLAAEGEGGMKSAVSTLLTIIYRIIESGVPADEVLQMSKLVRDYRHQSPVTEFVLNKWHAKSEKSYRLVRKLLKGAVSALYAEQDKKPTESQLVKIMNQLVAEPDSVSDFLSDFKNVNVDMDKTESTIIACADWFTARNLYQRLHVQLSKQPNDEELIEDIHLAKRSFARANNALIAVTNRKVDLY